MRLCRELLETSNYLSGTRQFLLWRGAGNFLLGTNFWKQGSAHNWQDYQWVPSLPSQCFGLVSVCMSFSSSLSLSISFSDRVFFFCINLILVWQGLISKPRLTGIHYLAQWLVSNSQWSSSPLLTKCWYFRHSLPYLPGFKKYLI